MLPFDNIKTHSQMHLYEKAKYHQIATIIYQSNRNASFLRKLGSFWKGGAFVSMGCGPAHAAFFSVHEFCKSHILTLDEYLRPLYFAVGGALACVTHDVVMTPFDAMKQRSQILHDQNNL